MHQTMMDDSPGYSFMPEIVIRPHVANKEAHPAPTKYLCKICSKSIAPTSCLKEFSQKAGQSCGQLSIYLMESGVGK
jgi:hypothetical protein